MIINTTEEFKIALENASNGDTLKLAGNHFIGPFFIDKAALTICSADADNPATIEDKRSKKPKVENFTVMVNAPVVTFRNLNFKTPDCISIRINESYCLLENIQFNQVKIAFICSAPNLVFKDVIIKHFTEDAIRLSSDNFRGENILIEDLYASDTEAHHDGIQLYAGKPNTALRHAGRYEGKYALNKGYLKNVEIHSTTDINRASIGKLQGIFASDGFMDGLQFEDIHVVTHDCIHGVSIRGIRTSLDGTPSVFKNISVKKTPGMSGDSAQIRLIPARRLTHTGMIRYKQTYTKSITEKKLNNFIDLEKDESNISDILFPPDTFRTDDSSNQNTVEKSIHKPSWECVQEGSYDKVQQRKIDYQITLHSNNDADVFNNFDCNDPLVAINKHIRQALKIDRIKFYDEVRLQPFNGRLMQQQVDGMEAILNEWDSRGLDDTRCLAYILATALHETAHTMQPIAEYGKGRRHSYGKADKETGKIYYGRGFVQITWKANYKRFSHHLGIDLLNDPEKALEPSIATKIIFDGMLKGMFTGRRLSHYFKEESDWFNARRIVNGLDKAERIGRYGRQFWYAILIAQGEIEKAVAVPKSITSIDGSQDSEVFSEVVELCRELG